MYLRKGRYSIAEIPHNPLRSSDEKYRVLFVSDLHIGAGYGTWKSETYYTFYRGGRLPFTAGRVLTAGGVRRELKERTFIDIDDGETVIFHNGISTWERGLIFIDRLIEEWDLTHPDCVILNGDIVSNEGNPDLYPESAPHAGDMEYHRWTAFMRDYCRRLDDAGIPWYFVYANHDDLTDEQFAGFFPYTKSFLVKIGSEAALVCADTFRDPVQTPELRRWGYGGPSDADAEFLNFCKENTAGVKDIFICPHYVNAEFGNLADYFFSEERAVCVIEGHSHLMHERTIAERGGRKLTAFGDGQFSWNADTWGLCTEETVAAANRIPDRSPVNYNFLYLVGREIGNVREIYRYPVFPELEYGVTCGSGGRYVTAQTFEAFRQPRYDGSVTMAHNGAGMICRRS